MEAEDGAGLGIAGSDAATLATLIGQHAADQPARPAIVLRKDLILTYAVLNAQVAALGARLRAAGIGPLHRVAVMVPDGPQLAVTIVGVTCHAVTLPLNPSITSAELEDLFRTLSVHAVVVADWIDTPVPRVAAQYGIRVLEVAKSSPEDLTISPRVQETQQKDCVCADTPAVILRTSGTTARSKLVPVTHRDLIAVTTRMRHWFALTPDDRTLCTMPLYYGQGLQNALFTPLILGGSIACPPRDAHGDILTWLSALRPTWYSAGPTFHMSLLDRALAHSGAPLRHSLRFIQSAAAPLPAAVRQGLEDVFGAPVLEGYGLSEAGLITANGVAPSLRKRGTVGRPWSDQLAVRGDDGGPLPPDVVGEIVVRGTGVMQGYLANEAANHAAFVDGWFRTGDLGSVDPDGFLTLSGRIKELINRGGEKVAPAEIDEALLRHPAVAEAAAFPLPHPRLGEDVAAAVVLRKGMVVSEIELRRHLREILVPFKIPRRIHTLHAFPTGDTGKIRRTELTRMFATQDRPIVDLPNSPLEIDIAAIWARLLGRETVGATDDFFELGGDSLLATQMLLELERLAGRKLPENVLFETATVRQLSELLVSTETATANFLIPLQTGGSRPPFIYLDGDLSSGGYYARRLAALVGPDQPFWILRPKEPVEGRLPSIEAMAGEYLAVLNEAGIRGPFVLGGFCNGALIALAMARQAESLGQPIDRLVMIEPISLNARLPMRLLLPLLGARMAFVWKLIERIDEQKNRLHAAIWLVGKTISRMKGRPSDSTADESPKLRIYHRVMARFAPAPITARIGCIVTESNRKALTYSSNVWRRFGSSLDVAVVPGEHLTCITTHVEVLAERLRAFLSAEKETIGEESQPVWLPQELEKELQ